MRRSLAGLSLNRGNLTEALSAASEMEHVGLVESLELCLLILDREPRRYARAALRWHGRFSRVESSLAGSGSSVFAMKEDLKKCSRED